MLLCMIYTDIYLVHIGTNLVYKKNILLSRGRGGDGETVRKPVSVCRSGRCPVRRSLGEPILIKIFFFWMVGTPPRARIPKRPERRFRAYSLFHWGARVRQLSVSNVPLYAGANPFLTSARRHCIPTVPTSAALIASVGRNGNTQAIMLVCKLLPETNMNCSTPTV